MDKKEQKTRIIVLILQKGYAKIGLYLIINGMRSIKMKETYSYKTGTSKIRTAIGSLYALTGLSVFAVVVTVYMLTAQSTHADTTASISSAVSVSVSNACTLTGGSDGTSSTGGVYSVTVPANNYREVDGSKLVAICNDAAGYAIYAVGYSGNSYTTPGNTTMISSVGTIPTNLNTSGGTSGWSMKLSQVSSGAPTIANSFDSYHVIPDTYTKVVSHNASTGSSSDAGTQVQTKYRIFVSSAQPAGTYTGKVKYTMVHPNNAAAPSVPVTLANATYMQDAIDCPNTTVGTIKTLTDNRDGSSYIVGKAADGNCWMLTNLKLGKTLSSGASLTLTPANSNTNSDFTLSYTNIPSDGHFHAYTIDGVEYQNNSNEFICRDDYDSCYYNWYTATAGAGTTYVTTGTVDTSICPSGWTLPTQPQFSSLYSFYPSAAQMEVDNPTTTKTNANGKIPGFLLSGVYVTGGALSLGSRGYYWSRSANSAQNAYHLYLHASSVYPAVINTKYLGFSVRCVLK